jgi:tRNA U34 5-methylaminomethyl-2-thiouridine-forming methyltransferase MnmC
MNNNKNPQPDPTYASDLLDELVYTHQAEADLMADALVQAGRKRLEHVQSDLGQTKSKKEQKPKAKRNSSAKREVDQEGDDDLDNESEENDVEDEFADEMESELKTVIEEIAEER